jgi:hypothetical protein
MVGYTAPPKETPVKHIPEYVAPTATQLEPTVTVDMEKVYVERNDGFGKVVEVPFGANEWRHDAGLGTQVFEDSGKTYNGLRQFDWVREYSKSWGKR